MRMSLCRALVLLRHKGLLQLTDLLQLFFDLLKCQDKPLRKFLRDHIVTDLKNVNAKSKVTNLHIRLSALIFSSHCLGRRYNKMVSMFAY